MGVLIPGPAPTDPSHVATKAYVDAAVGAVGSPNLSAYAPLASPAFTGAPTAPTPGGSSNNTAIATTAYVDTGRLGLDNYDLSNQDLNNILATGFYRGSTLTNGPTGNDWYWVLVQSHDRNAWISQTAWGYTGNGSNRMFWRYRNNGTWQAWNEVASTSTAQGYANTAQTNAQNNAATDAQNRANTAQTNAQNWTQSYFVQKSGDTMTGGLTVNGQVINSNGRSRQTGAGSTDVDTSGVGTSNAVMLIDSNGYIGRGSGLFYSMVGYNTAVSGRPAELGTNGKLGYLSSSRRFKELHDQPTMDDAALEKWLALPVHTFHYHFDRDKREKIGLVAEEVHEAGYEPLVIYNHGEGARGTKDWNRVDGVDYRFMGVYNKMALSRLLERVEQLEQKVTA